LEFRLTASTGNDRPGKSASRAAGNTAKMAAAQIDIAPGVVTFFNPGFSLVDRTGLPTGMKSQSRNPLIARALRLIGFAELAASGLRELQRVWQTANRQPPQLSSDEKTNSFTLVLDWREASELHKN